MRRYIILIRENQPRDYSPREIQPSALGQPFWPLSLLLLFRKQLFNLPKLTCAPLSGCFGKEYEHISGRSNEIKEAYSPLFWGPCWFVGLLVQNQHQHAHTIILITIPIQVHVSRRYGRSCAEILTILGILYHFSSSKFDLHASGYI